MEKLLKPSFLKWTDDELAILMSSPPGSRNFDERTPLEQHSQIYQDDTSKRPHLITREIHDFFFWLDNIYRAGWKAGLDADGNAAKIFHRMDEYLPRFRDVYSGEMVSVWEDYEDYLWGRATISDGPRPSTQHIHELLKAIDSFSNDHHRFCKHKAAYNMFSLGFIASTGILHISARLIILFLLFTPLRAAPKGLYNNTPWTRFLPSFS